MEKFFNYECLYCFNTDENRIEERYDSIKAAVYFNPGYNYASLRNAISKGIKYKGYYWEWADADLDAHDQLYLMIKRHEEKKKALEEAKLKRQRENIEKCVEVILQKRENKTTYL